MPYRNGFVFCGKVLFLWLLTIAGRLFVTVVIYECKAADMYDLCMR